MRQMWCGSRRSGAARGGHAVADVIGGARALDDEQLRRMAGEMAEGGGGARGGGGATLTAEQQTMLEAGTPRRRSRGLEGCYEIEVDAVAQRGGGAVIEAERAVGEEWRSLAVGETQTVAKYEEAQVRVPGERGGQPPRRHARLATLVVRGFAALAPHEVHLLVEHAREGAVARLDGNGLPQRRATTTVGLANASTTHRSRRPSGRSAVSNFLMQCWCQGSTVVTQLEGPAARRSEPEPEPER